MRTRPRAVATRGSGSCRHARPLARPRSSAPPRAGHRPPRHSKRATSATTAAFRLVRRRSGEPPREFSRHRGVPTAPSRHLDSTSRDAGRSGRRGPAREPRSQQARGGGTRQRHPTTIASEHPPLSTRHRPTHRAHLDAHYPRPREHWHYRHKVHPRQCHPRHEQPDQQLRDGGRAATPAPRARGGDGGQDLAGGGVGTPRGSPNLRNTGCGCTPTLQKRQSSFARHGVV
jgi:hypothetical protein